MAFLVLAAGGLWLCWHWFHLLIALYRDIRRWFHARKTRKAHLQWVLAGFVEVRPAHYMRVRDFSDKQLRFLAEGRKMRMGTLRMDDR